MSFFINHQKLRNARQFRGVQTCINKAIVGALLIGSIENLDAEGWNFNWQGDNDWSMTGMFTFEMDNGNGLVTEDELTGFMMTISDGSTSESWDRFADGLGPGNVFLFNFDTITQTLGEGGLPSGPEGQVWNTDEGGTFICDPVFPCFASGSFIQIAGHAQDELDTRHPSTVAVDDLLKEEMKGVVPIPEPSTYALLGSMLALPHLWRKRRKVKWAEPSKKLE